MKQYGTFSLLVMLKASLLFAQSPANFSGTWMLDNAKSDALYREFKVVCTIKQTPDSILIERNFIKKNGEKIISPSIRCKLNGEETSKKLFNGIFKTSAKWSPDNKILIITNTRTVGDKVSGSKISYKLSANGLVLTMHTTDINTTNGDAIIQIFNKKLK